MSAIQPIDADFLLPELSTKDRLACPGFSKNPLILSGELNMLVIDEMNLI